MGLQKMKCPICGTKTEDHQYWDDYTVVEDESICPKEYENGSHYMYIASYGSYCLVIGKQMWEWSYDQSRPEQKEIEAAIERAKNELV